LGLYPAGHIIALLQTEDPGLLKVFTGQGAQAAPGLDANVFTAHTSAVAAFICISLELMYVKFSTELAYETP
jgi:hypothetical protein